MGNTFREGGDEGRLNELVALGKGRQSFARWFTAFPDNAEFTDIIRRSFSTKLISQGRHASLRIRPNSLYAFASVDDSLFGVGTPDYITVLPEELPIPPRRTEPDHGELPLTPINLHVLVFRDRLTASDRAWFNEQTIRCADLLGLDGDGGPVLFFKDACVLADGKVVVFRVDAGDALILADVVATAMTVTATDVLVASDSGQVWAAVAALDAMTLNDAQVVSALALLGITDAITAADAKEMLIAGACILDTTDALVVADTKDVSVAGAYTVSKTDALIAADTKSVSPYAGAPALLEKTDAGVLGTTHTITAVDANLITNGSFEAALAGTWGTSGAVSRVSSGGQVGAYASLTNYTSSWTSAAINQNFAVSSNTEYEFSFYARRITSGGSELVIASVFDEHGAEYLGLGGWVWPLSPWEKYSFVFTTVATTSNLTVNIRNNYAFVYSVVGIDTVSMVAA